MSWCRVWRPSRRQLGLGIDYPAVAHRLVLRGICLDLRAVQRDMAELDQPGLPAQFENLQHDFPQRVAYLRNG